MAQKVQVMLLCDLDEGNVDAEETVQFSLGSTAYEVDVCAKHAQQIREGLEPFVANARKAGTSTTTRRRPRTAGAHGEQHRFLGPGRQLGAGVHVLMTVQHSCNLDCRFTLTHA